MSQKEDPAPPFFGTARAHHALEHELQQALHEVLESGQSLQGQAVTELEQTLAESHRRNYAIAVNSCTDALFFALKSLGVKNGDEILVPAFSFIATASPILRAGATPVFVDVDEKGLIDLNTQPNISKNAKAIIVAHLYGATAEPSDIIYFAKRHGLYVIEDCAQALGSRHGSTIAGAFGDIACLSFDPTKPVSSLGSGGAVLCDDLGFAKEILQLRYHGFDDRRNNVTLGYNSQLPTVSAAALLVKLRKHSEWTERRREIAEEYLKKIKCDLSVATPNENTYHIFHKFVMRVPKHLRTAIRNSLADRSVPTGIHYEKPLFDNECFRLFRPTQKLPRTVALTNTVLSLPIHAYLTNREVTHIIESVNSSLDQCESEDYGDN